MPYSGPTMTIESTEANVAPVRAHRLMLYPDPIPLPSKFLASDLGITSPSTTPSTISSTPPSTPPSKSTSPPTISSTPIKSSIRNRRSTSLPETLPQKCCHVRFPHNLERIKFFSHLDEPTALQYAESISEIQSEENGEEWVDSVDGEDEDEDSCSTEDEAEEGWCIRRSLVNFPPFPSSQSLNADVYIKGVDLCSSTAFHDGPPTCLRGRVAVKNLAFKKSVTIRWTVDDWKSYSEVLASFLHSIRGRVYDEYEFEIGFDELERNTTERTLGGKWFEKHLKFEVRYRCDNLEIWEDNHGEHYEVLLARSANFKRGKLELERHKAIKRRVRQNVSRSQSLDLASSQSSFPSASTSRASSDERAATSTITPNLIMPPTPRPHCRPLPPIPIQQEISSLNMNISNLSISQPEQRSRFEPLLLRRRSSNDTTLSAPSVSRQPRHASTIPPLPDPMNLEDIPLNPGVTSVCLKGGDRSFVDCSTCELRGCEGFQW